MIDNPFAVIERRLNRLESLLLDLKQINNSPQPKPSDRCGLIGALEFLNDEGYKISKSQLYKLSSTNGIPCSLAGSRLIFSKKQLASWIESQTKAKDILSGIDLALAKSARKKKGGRNA